MYNQQRHMRPSFDFASLNLQADARGGAVANADKVKYHVKGHEGTRKLTWPSCARDSMIGRRSIGVTDMCCMHTCWFRLFRLALMGVST